MQATNAIHRKTFTTPLGSGELVTEQRHNGGFTEVVYRKSAQVECSIQCDLVARGWPGCGAVLLTSDAQRRLEAGIASMLQAQKVTSAELAPFVAIRSVVSNGANADGTFHAIVSFDYLQGCTYSDGD